MAVYVNKNIGKLYIDHFRATVVNRIMKGAGMFTFEVITQDQPVLIKNIRLAAGGSDAYNKVMSEGKFIAHGIQFDVNKSVLKPESMGAINEVFSMLQKYPDLKFEIGGHTDSDGAKELNDRLSAARAEAVKNQLVQMGINASRLTVKGYGSSQPITDNSSPEGKANNRRVEFKKIN